MMWKIKSELYSISLFYYKNNMKIKYIDLE